MDQSLAVMQHQQPTVVEQMGKQVCLKFFKYLLVATFQFGISFQSLVSVKYSTTGKRSKGETDDFVVAEVDLI